MYMFVYFFIWPKDLTLGPSFVGTKSTGVCHQTQAQGTVCRRKTMGRKTEPKEFIQQDISLKAQILGGDRFTSRGLEEAQACLRTSSFK